MRETRARPAGSRHAVGRIGWRRSSSAAGRGSSDPAGVGAGAGVSRPGGCYRRGRGREGFTLVEALLAVVLVGFVALAAASAEAWAARATAFAEAREDAATAAELILDSLALVPAPTGGTTRVDAVELEWTVEGGGSAAEIRLRARPQGPGLGVDSFDVVWAAPPSTLEDGP